MKNGTQKKLGKRTIEILEDRAEIIEQFTGEDWDVFGEDAPKLREAVRTNTLCPACLETLDDYLTRDGWDEPKFHRSVRADLARQGLLEVYSDKVWSTHRIKTVTVDGVKYFADGWIMESNPPVPEDRKTPIPIGTYRD